jgi:hypothetical protein
MKDLGVLGKNCDRGGAFAPTGNPSPSIFMFRQLINARRVNANNLSCLTRRHCCTTRAVNRRKKCATSWPIGCEGGGARECASIHAVVPDVLYLLRVAWCALHALYRARAAYAAVTFLRSCMRWGMALGWMRSRGDL